jgi:type 1 fimbria pilin
VKSVTADLSQIDRHLPIAGFDAAGTGHDQALNLQDCSTAVSQHVGVAFHGVADGKNPDVLSVGEGCLRPRREIGYC